MQGYVLQNGWKPTWKYLNRKSYLHLPYSPDIAPSDYHLFQLIAHGLAEQHFHSYEDAKKWVDTWLALKDVLFVQHKIQMLPERWEKVVASNGQYFQWNVSY